MRRKEFASRILQSRWSLFCHRFSQTFFLKRQRSGDSNYENSPKSKETANQLAQSREFREMFLKRRSQSCCVRFTSSLRTSTKHFIPFPPIRASLSILPDHHFPILSFTDFPPTQRRTDDPLRPSHSSATPRASSSRSGSNSPPIE